MFEVGLNSKGEDLLSCPKLLLKNYSSFLAIQGCTGTPVPTASYMYIGHLESKALLPPTDLE